MVEPTRRALLRTIGALSMLVAVGSTAHAQKPPAFVAGRLLVRFQPMATADQVRSVVAAAKARDTGSIPRIGVHILQLPAGASETAMARAFAQRPEVVFAELDEKRKPDATPNDPGYSSEWHLPKINANAAWDKTVGSTGVTIAILDTGVDGTHPDLAPKMVAGWNFYDNNSNTSDVYGHGTATAGTATACSNNGNGVASIAWNCMLMPIRITDTSGYALYSTAASALTWAADHGARVANLSFQMSDSAAVSSAAQYFQGKGGVVTISAGNYSTISTSADNPYVLTVSATDGNDALASWSNTGSNIDLAAPGVGIYTTCNGGGYGSWSGTSFSAPIVAGVAALVLSANPSLSGAQARDILMKSADDLGTLGWDPQYGAGRVNAANAVAMALSSTGPDTTPPTASFTNPANGSIVAGNVAVQVNANDNVAVASVALALDNTTVATLTSAPYTFAWNTLRVANGMHTLTATASDAAGNQAVLSIAVTVGNAADTTAPTVSIVSVTGAKGGGALTVTASATDNFGVKRVEIWADGSLAQTDTSAPWAFSVNSRKWATGAHTVQCRAYDAVGNVGYSQTVTVTK
jgi:thermitase